jgi:hypothetical protein
MPRYFFHVINGEFVPDEIGTECATADEVKDEAVRATGEMLKEQGLNIWKTKRFYMFVADEQNQTCLKLAFDVEDLTGEMR